MINTLSGGSPKEPEASVFITPFENILVNNRFFGCHTPTLFPINRNEVLMMNRLEKTISQNEKATDTCLKYREVCRNLGTKIREVNELKRQKYMLERQMNTPPDKEAS